MVDSSPLKLMHKIFKDALPLENGALQRVAHLCIHVSVDGYLWSGFNNAELLSVTCRTVNISVAMVDSSSPKFCLNFWGILCILGNNALQKVTYLCIHVSVDDMAGQGSTASSYWATYAELQTWLGWIVPRCVSLLQPHLPNASITSSECSNTVEFISIFPYKLFRESLQIQNLVTFSQHQCKITWRKLCFQGLHQWLSIITIATLGSFWAMLQQTNNLNETF